MNNDFDTITLEEFLQASIGLALQRDAVDQRIVLFVPIIETKKLVCKRLHELLGTLPLWLCPPLVRKLNDHVEFENGVSIRIHSSPLMVRGLTVTHVGMYVHPNHPWSNEDLYTIIPAFCGDHEQNFFWVTE